jgi:hypothetical protein
MAWPKLRKRRSLVTFSNRGGAATPAPTAAGPGGSGRSGGAGGAGGKESDSGESVRLIWPGGNGAGATPAPAAASAPVVASGASAPSGASGASGVEAAADPDDLPFWDWSGDQSELDDPSDAFAPDRPEDPDGPDYPDYWVPVSTEPPRATPAPQVTDESRRPRRSERSGWSERSERGKGLWRPTQAGVTPVAAQAPEPRREGIGQHLGNLAHLSANPRRRAWVWRAVLAAAIMIALSIVANWLVGLTLAVLAVIADTIIRSRRASVGPAAARQTAAQRHTRKQLASLERAGYRAVHDIAIPGSEDQIDHLVIGPAGVFAIDSEAWDKRLPVRTRNARQLWLGPFSMKDRLEHARWEAERAATQLSGVAGTHVTVRPAMAVYGPKIHWDVATIRDVDVFSGPKLRKYLRRAARQKDTRLLSDGEVERIDKATRTAFPQAFAG